MLNRISLLSWSAAALAVAALAGCGDPVAQKQAERDAAKQRTARSEEMRKAAEQAFNSAREKGNAGLPGELHFLITNDRQHLESIISTSKKSLAASPGKPGG